MSLSLTTLVYHWPGRLRTVGSGLNERISQLRLCFLVSQIFFAFTLRFAIWHIWWVWHWVWGGVLQKWELASKFWAKRLRKRLPTPPCAEDRSALAWVMFSKPDVFLCGTLGIASLGVANKLKWLQSIIGCQSQTFLCQAAPNRQNRKPLHIWWKRQFLSFGPQITNFSG